MSQRQESEERDRANQQHSGETRGNEDLRFLDLELSQALFGEASKLAYEAYRQLLSEKIKTKIAAKLDAELDALAELAAEDFIEDMVANLEIEARITQRAELRKSQGQRLREIFGRAQESDDDRDRS